MTTTGDTGVEQSFAQTWRDDSGRFALTAVCEGETGNECVYVSEPTEGEIQGLLALAKPLDSQGSLPDMPPPFQNMLRAYGVPRRPSVWPRIVARQHLLCAQFRLTLAGSIVFFVPQPFDEHTDPPLTISSSSLSARTLKEGLSQLLWEVSSSNIRVLRRSCFAEGRPRELGTR
ncbi:hypothetical protein MRX96_041163 [Rhipicephalus microplus]